jgi:hypothetical protein
MATIEEVRAVAHLVVAHPTYVTWSDARACCRALLAVLDLGAGNRNKFDADELQAAILAAWEGKR